MLFTISLLCEIISAQDSIPSTSFELGYSYQQVKMNRFNQYIFDPVDFKLVKHCKNPNLAFNVRINKTFELGVYGEYQFAKNITYPIQKKLNPDFTITLIEGVSTRVLRTINTGISLTFYYDHFLGLKNHENAWDRLNLGVETNGGVGFNSYYQEDQNKTTNPIGFTSRYFKGKALHLNVGAIVEYLIIKSPLFLAIGFKGGYQFYFAETMKNKVGKEWRSASYNPETSPPINLNFSGFYYGVYLKIGK